MSTSLIVLGATGLVGRTMLRVLEERQVPVGDLRLLAGESAALRTIEFRGRAIPVRPVAAEAFAGADLALFACKNPVAQRWAPVARAAGVTVVDASSAFRYDDAVPLVVPEVNGLLLADHPPLVANPNCSTIAIAAVLAPLARAAGLERVVVSTYQSVSGAGREALEELERGIRGGLDGPPPARRDGGPPFAFNVIPHIDRFEANGYSREEMKVVWETRKILGLPTLAITATAVRVPVRVGHTAAINVILDRAMDPDEARALWAATPGITVVDDPESGRYPTTLAAAGRDDVLVGRARRDVSHPRGLECFVASDNLRKGAATNAVQIVEALLAVPGGLRRAGPPPAGAAAGSR
ncbi:MAG: aspartate-semialdehyde dehydrogenase [Candidatus Eisenbacteria bacterium]|uniref:Aspartate-semialdehyde dehydrogenase n=1 Tax=Eiseniibacteriota bacterium TaxID=2212470 RepID=A0A9D6QMJ5_UNCEI|nr:aspartate-semialdehyde dehydrogenase [Candidatus Eisenbacteria bacterium]MBI3539828.1 aspartate-semialdehyde dehydrogenase [Candidatus Eisenbacteria bacterium]